MMNSCGYLVDFSAEYLIEYSQRNGIPQDFDESEDMHMKKLIVILAALGILCAAAGNGSSAPDRTPDDGKSYEIGVPSPEKIERRLGDIKEAASDLASDFSVQSIPADESSGGRTIIIRFGDEA